jgi:hypothetical protein
MSVTRQKRKPVFDPTALGEDLDDLWPSANPHTAAPTSAPQAASEPVSAPPSAPPRPTAVAAPTPVATAPSTPPASRATTSGPADPPHAATSASTEPRLRGVPQTPTLKRIRPPEVLLSSEVYDELYRVQIAEKKVRRGLARTMGTIVLDAIEAHAPELATTWSSQHFAVGEGQLFERPSSKAVPRRRRHASAPRTVVLSGVTAANGQRLDNLVQAWGAGTRSALVEQALRYEFGQLPY